MTISRTEVFNRSPQNLRCKYINIIQLYLYT